MANKIPSWIPPIIVVFLLICLYGFTTSTRLTWANNGSDGGDFIAAILSGGIPHPTGYPTYMILGQLFQWIPLGDAYFRVVLLSFLPAALAAGFFVIWVNSFCPGYRMPGMIGGLLWGMSPLLWSQAVIVEVYGLQAFFTVLALWWITLLFRPREKNPLWLVVLALVFGTGLGNHATILLILPACIAGLVYWGKKTRRYEFVILQIGAVLLGSLVYLYLPMQARGFPPVNWGNPQTLNGFLWEISGESYQSLLGSILINTAIERVLAFGVILRQQVGIVGLILGVIGAYQLHQVDRKLRWVGLWVFFASLIFAISYNTSDSTAYLIPVLMIFCGWIGISIYAFKDQTWKRVSITSLVSLIVIVFILIRTPETINQINPQKGYSAADFAENALSQLPENAIIMTSSDLDSFPLWAYQYGFGLRKDVSIIVLPLTQFDWYQQTLVHTYPGLNLPYERPSLNHTPNWEDQMSALNPDNILCTSEVITKTRIEIIFTCSNGKIIMHP